MKLGYQSAETASASQNSGTDPETERAIALSEYIQEVQRHADFYGYCRLSIRETLHFGEPNVCFVVAAMTGDG